MSAPAMAAAARAGAAGVAEITAFLTREAMLLDEWRLDEWLRLLTEDVQYLVPSLDTPEDGLGEALFLIADDRERLESRVRQLLGRSHWAESPRSRTRRLVTNVLVLDAHGDEVRFTANFAVWRFQHGETDVFVGRYVHRAVQAEDGLRLRERKAILDLETLRPHGKLSFIL